VAISYPDPVHPTGSGRRVPRSRSWKVLWYDTRKARFFELSVVTQFFRGTSLYSRRHTDSVWPITYYYRGSLNNPHWSFEDDAGIAIKHPDGRYVQCRDSDNLAPDDAVQRNCSHCHATQMKRPDGRWSGDGDACPCCEELLSEHARYYCTRCGHGAPRPLVTQQERDYFSSHDQAGTGGSIIMGIPADMRRQ